MREKNKLEKNSQFNNIWNLKEKRVRRIRKKKGKEKICYFQSQRQD